MKTFLQNGYFLLGYLSIIIKFLKGVHLLLFLIKLLLV